MSQLIYFTKCASLAIISVYLKFSYRIVYLQKDVYEASTKFLIDNVVTGYNATVFAYGATGNTANSEATKLVWI